MSDLPNSTSISAAAHAYQLAMSQQTPSTTPPVPVLLPANEDSSSHPSGRDTVMTGTAPEAIASPAPPAAVANAPSPAPRTGTPGLQQNGNNVSSRAASQHPDVVVMPTEAPPHGAPVRQYLNTKVTSVLLEGMKQIAKDQPKDPLRVLGEYLLQRSKEIEGQ